MILIQSIYIILIFNCSQYMKAHHKRIPSGIQNSSLLQNTQRINQPKMAIQEKETARKMKVSQEDFYKVLNDTQTLQLYNMMTDFQAAVDQCLFEGNLDAMAECCANFKQKVSSFCLQYIRESQQIHKQDETEKIKQLLQQIYQLRKKVADLDSSLILDSISSLQDNYAKTAERNKLKQVENNTQHNNDIAIVSESIMNFMQLKQMVYDLLSIVWKYTSFHFEDQSIIMLQNLKIAYKYQLQLSFYPYNHRSASVSLDKISSLIAIARNCILKLKQSQISNNIQASVNPCA